MPNPKVAPFNYEPSNGQEDIDNELVVLEQLIYSQTASQYKANAADSVTSNNLI